jgi:hypothetical protein
MYPEFEVIDPEVPVYLNLDKSQVHIQSRIRHVLNVKDGSGSRALRKVGSGKR